MARKEIPPETFLASLPLFKELGAATLARLATGTTRRPLKRGETLFRQGEPATGMYVYTLAAHFQVEQLVDGDWNVIYGPRSIGGDLWVEGPDSKDAYRAEINSEGWLLYGFNWDTRELSSGTYKLSFWIGDVPVADPLGNPIDAKGVDITSGAPGDTVAESGEILAEVAYSEDFQMSTLILELLPKEHGRGVSGK